MDAEMIRDTALSASGLLSGKVGGASVKPYQPDGVWEAVAMPGSNTSYYKREAGESLYRRSLYTFWKRTAPAAVDGALQCSYPRNGLPASRPLEHSRFRRSSP